MRRLALASLCLSLAACTLDRGTLSLHLVQSPLGEEDPLPDPAAADGGTAAVTALRVRVEGGGSGVIERTFPFAGRGGKATLPGVDVGGGRVVSVEGVGPSGVTFSRGATAPLTIAAGESFLTVYIGRVGQFSATPAPMRQPRAFHATVVLGDGRVLLVGGTSAIDRQHGAPFAVVDALGTAEVLDATSASFDPATLDCAVARPRDCLGRPRAFATATLLGSGVLVAGGEDASGPLGDAELLDPDDRLFAPGGALPEARSRHAAAPVGAGAALFGGFGSSGLVDDVAVFASGRFQAGAHASPRQAATATELADGRVLFAGGRNADSEVVVVELFDGTAVTPVGPLGRARAYHTATRLPDGRVLILGGLASGLAVAAPEIYDPATGTSTPIDAPALLDRWAHAATLLGDGRVLVTGGFGGGTYGSARREVEILDATHLVAGASGALTGLAVTRTAAMATARAGHSASLMANGFVLVAGGVNENNAAQASAEVLVLER